MKRTTQDKLKLFKQYFMGRTDVFGTYNPDTGRSLQIKRDVTDDVLLKHLTGKQPYGVYLLMENTTRAIAADFDVPDPRFPISLVEHAMHFGLSGYIERSKSKGHHVWFFFAGDGVPALKARQVMKFLLAEIEQPHTEIFPKQDLLDSRIAFGNFINAPLFGQLVLQGRTVFVKPDLMLEPFPNQWDVLEGIKLIPETKLDEIIEINELDKGASSQQPPLVPADNGESREGFGILPPCARTMLGNGVIDNQRVACFRLAVHFHRLGFPLDIAIAALSTWAAKNHPAQGKRIITQDEIREQATYAYRNQYRSSGCESPAVQPFCEPSCTLASQRKNKGRA